MKKIFTLFTALLLVSVAQAGIIDNFDDGTMTEYTQTVVLETTDPGATYDTVFSNASGALQADLSAYPGIEQALCLRDDIGVNVGEILKIDTTGFGTDQSQDLGIAVSATATPPAGGPRQDYVFIFCRGWAGQLGTRSFDGTTETTLVQSWPGSAVDALFIERTGANSWDTGYYLGGIKTTIHSMTVANASIGDALGLYSDMRAVGTIGTFDNLEIVPEPATIALLGLGGLLLRRKRD